MQYRFSNLFNAPILSQLVKLAQRAPAKLLAVAGLGLAIAAIGVFGFGLSLLSPLVVAAGLISTAILGLLSYEYKRLIPWFTKRKSYPKTLDTGPIIINNKTIAHLDYIKDLPILYLHTTDAKLSGQALAKAFKTEIIDSLDKYYDFLPTAAKLLHFNTPHYEKDISEYLRVQREKYNVCFPKHFEQQLEGLVDELNDIIKEDNKKWVIQRPPLTVEHLKNLIVFADFLKLGACTSGTTDNALFRNLDWPSFGVMDMFSVIIASQIITDKKSANVGPNKPQATLNFTFQPGVAGLSMANDKGLSLAINEATKMGTVRINKGGIPEVILIRDIARNCSTVKEVIQFLKRHQPLSSHILFVKDKFGDSAKIQMLPPKPNDKKLFTVVQRDHDGHIVGANHHICPESRQIHEETVGWHDSKDRFDKAHSALKDDHGAAGALQASNCTFSIHSIIFKYKPDFFGFTFKRSAYNSAHSTLPLIKGNIDELLDRAKKPRGG